MKTFVFVKTSSLGDVVHQMPAMTDARRHESDARIVWIVEEMFAPLARLHPAVDEVIPVATRRWRSQLLRPAIWRQISNFRAGLKKLAAEKVIDTQGLIRSALIARSVAGIHHGYDASSIREPIASVFYDVKHSVSRNQHAVTRNRALTAASLGYVPNLEISYGLVRPSSDVAAPYAVLLHGTSKATKEWRESDWIGLGKWIRAQGLDVLLPWGNERERLRSQRLASGIPGAHILERQPLDVTAKVIANASFVVGVDTGLLHLAAAYSVPLIAIFLATDPGLTGPIGSGPIAVLGGKGAYPAFSEVIREAEGRNLLPIKS
jgi:heptosyltransferase-1